MTDKIAPVVVRSREVAAMLGWSTYIFRRQLPRLREHGFPPYDDVVEGYHAPDIEAWLTARRNGAAAKTQKKEVNYDAL